MISYILHIDYTRNGNKKGIGFHNDSLFTEDDVLFCLGFILNQYWNQDADIEFGTYKLEKEIIEYELLHEGEL